MTDLSHIDKFIQHARITDTHDDRCEICANVRHPMWHLVDALSFWNVAAPHLDTDGFLCGIYGSVLAMMQTHALARDLDLLAIPKCINTSIDLAVRRLAGLMCACLSAPYEGLMGTEAYLLVLPDGRLVDIQFYKTAGPRSAEEMYATGRSWRTTDVQDM